jgi:hypothetical protein
MALQVNRAEQLWKNWEDKQKELESIAGVNMLDKDNLKFKYDFLRKGMYRIFTNPSEREKLYPHVIKSVTAKLEKQLYPSFLQRLLHRIYVATVVKPDYLLAFAKNKQENLEQLNTDLKAACLDFFSRDLETFLDYETPKISVGVQTRLNDNNGLQISIEMEKDKFGSYLFNGYDVTHINEQGTKNTAFFSKESQISLKEATNLLQGRAIFKSYVDYAGVVTKKWTQLDFTQEDLKIETFSPAIAYDLKKILIDHAAQLEFYGITKEAVQHSLEQGDLVGFEITGKGKFHLQASPGQGMLKFSDQDKLAISFSELIKQVHQPEQQKTMDTKFFKQNGIQQDNGLSISK